MATRSQSMKLLGQFIKDDQVVDTYIVEVASEGDLAEACCKAFDYFRDHYPNASLLDADADVRIEFKRSTMARIEKRIDQVCRDWPILRRDARLR